MQRLIGALIRHRFTFVIFFATTTFQTPTKTTTFITPFTDADKSGRILEVFVKALDYDSSFVTDGSFADDESSPATSIDGWVLHKECDDRLPLATDITGDSSSSGEKDHPFVYARLKKPRKRYYHSDSDEVTAPAPKYVILSD